MYHPYRNIRFNAKEATRAELFQYYFRRISFIERFRERLQSDPLSVIDYVYSYADRDELYHQILLVEEAYSDRQKKDREVIKIFIYEYDQLQFTNQATELQEESNPYEGVAITIDWVVNSNWQTQFKRSIIFDYTQFGLNKSELAKKWDVSRMFIHYILKEIEEEGAKAPL